MLRRRAQPLLAVAVAGLVLATAIALPLGGPASATDDRPGCRAVEDLPRHLRAAFTEDPGAGTWQPWFVDPADHRPPPPPGGRAQAAELREVLRLQRERTPAQEAEARLWAEGHAVRPWTLIYFALVTEPGNPKALEFNPPRLSREYALLHLAIYDALIAAHAAKDCHLRPAPHLAHAGVEPAVEVPPAPSYPSEHAVAAGAAQVVMRHFFPGKPAGFFRDLAERAAEARVVAGASYRSDVEAGLALGRAVAREVLAARAGDGSDAAWDGRSGRLEGPCRWKPTAPDHEFPPAEPLWGRVAPFVLERGDQFRPPPPPACDGAHYLAEYRVLFEMSKNLTARQREISDYWEQPAGTVSPPGQNLQVALAKTLEHDLTTMRAARVLAYTAAALADAGIAAWDAKYTYWYDRPILAIRRLGWDVQDGLCEGVPEDPRTGGCWRPHAETPPFPGYVSGHSTFTGAGMQVLKHFFPGDVPELRAYQTEASNARLYGGIHAGFDNEVGKELGLQVGNAVVERAKADGAE